MTGNRSRRLRTRVVVGCAVAAATAAASASAAIGWGGSDPGTAPRRDMPGATTQITRQTLVDSATITGELGYGQAVPVESKAAGTVTWLPAVGRTVSRGRTLLRADDKPVVLLYGPLPMYRRLAAGAKGPDVAQFERNLAALGYSGFTVDEEFSRRTAAAVRRWQEDLGRARNGAVGVDQVVYAPRAVRVAQHQVRVGASATGEVLAYTRTAKSATAEVRVAEAAWAVRGRKVDVRLPGGTTVRGTVASVGDEAASGQSSDEGGAGSGGGSGSGGQSGTGGQSGSAGGQSGAGAGDATVPVTVTIAGQRALRGLERSPVDISYTAEQRKNVLTVPVAALLALAEGGYGLELVAPPAGHRQGDGRGTRIVPVVTGLFADGRVEVRGPGLAPGRRVGMPG